MTETADIQVHPIDDSHGQKLDAVAVSAFERLREVALSDSAIRESIAIQSFNALALAGQHAVMETERPELAERAEHFLSLGIPLSTALIGRYALHHENPHSALLGFLLDPMEAHGAGALFLREFLKLTGLQGELSSTGVDRWLSAVREMEDHISVAVDAPLPNIQKRPDIRLSFGAVPEKLILIETKVNATEQEDQCSEYRHAALDLLDGREDDLLLVFLTPRGRKATTDVPDKWVPLSFTTLRDALLRWASTESTPMHTCTLLRNWALEIDKDVVRDDAKLRAGEHWQDFVKTFSKLEDGSPVEEWIDLKNLMRLLKPVVGEIEE